MAAPQGGRHNPSCRSFWQPLERSQSWSSRAFSWAATCWQRPSSGTWRKQVPPPSLRNFFLARGDRKQQTRRSDLTNNLSIVHWLVTWLMQRRSAGRWARSVYCCNKWPSTGLVAGDAVPIPLAGLCERSDHRELPAACVWDSDPGRVFRVLSREY